MNQNNPDINRDCMKTNFTFNEDEVINEESDASLNDVQNDNDNTNDEDKKFKYYRENDVFINESNDKMYKSARVVNKEPVVYSIGQVVEKLEDLDLTPSTIRYWATEYADYLHIKKSGKNRFFTDTNIEQLRFIHHLLKVQNLTSLQVKDYLKTTNAQVMKPMENQNEFIINNVMAESVVAGITETIDLSLERMTQQIENKFTEQIQNMKDHIDNLENKISEKMDLVSNNLVEYKTEVEAHLSEGNASVEIIRRDEEIVKLKEKLNTKSNDDNDKKEKKSLIDRLLGR